MAGERGGPIHSVGPSIAVEGSWLWPGGSGHHLELGIRGETWSRPSALGGHELTLFGAARVTLTRRPIAGLIWPILGGGLRVGTAADGGSGAAIVVGPQVVGGIELPLLAGTALHLELRAHATLTDPLRMTLAFGIAILALE